MQVSMGLPECVWLCALVLSLSLSLSRPLSYRCCHVLQWNNHQTPMCSAVSAYVCIVLIQTSRLYTMSNENNGKIISIMKWSYNEPQHILVNAVASKGNSNEIIIICICIVYKIYSPLILNESILFIEYKTYREEANCKYWITRICG